MAMAMAISTPPIFGEYPLHVTVDVETGVHAITQEDTACAAACAIPETFEQERLSIMQARGAAYGYVLIFPQEEVVEPPAKG